MIPPDREECTCDMAYLGPVMAQGLERGEICFVEFRERYPLRSKIAQKLGRHGAWFLVKVCKICCWPFAHDFLYRNGTVVYRSPEIVTEILKRMENPQTIQDYGLSVSLREMESCELGREILKQEGWDRDPPYPTSLEDRRRV